MNFKYINTLLNDILCRLQITENIKNKKVVIKEEGVTKTEDVSSINFTGNVQVTSDTQGNTEVNIPTQGAEAQCEECLEFDGDRPITRNVLGLLGQNLQTDNIKDTLEELLYPYLAPSILLTAPNNTVVEKNTGNSNVTLTAASTKNTNDITLFKFFLNNVEINSPSVNANGQTATYVHSTSNNDGTDLTPLVQTFKAQVGDGTTTVDSNTRTRTLVYPFYNGVGTNNLNAAGIQALSKSVVVQGNRGHSFSPSNQKIYFAYPGTYGNLMQIDDGALNVTSAFTLRTASFTMLDGQSVTYNIYESNNLLTITDYNLNFKFS